MNVFIRPFNVVKVPAMAFSVIIPGAGGRKVCCVWNKG